MRICTYMIHADGGDYNLRHSFLRVNPVEHNLSFEETCIGLS